MPTYNFECKECNTQFEKFILFKELDTTKVECSCGSANISRQLECGIMFFDSDPKTVGSWAERNYSRLGEASRSRIEQKKVEDKETQRQVISPNAKSVLKTPSEVKSKWPKLSKEALKKIDVKEYITSDCEPKEM